MSKTITSRTRPLVGIGLVLALTMAVLVTLGSGIAEATHFRSGSVHYMDTSPGSGNTINFTIQSSFRRNGYSCVDPSSGFSTSCTGSGGLPGPGDVIREQIGGTSLNFGDGSGTPTLHYLVDSVDVTNNWLFGLALDPGDLTSTVISHTYPAPGTYTAEIDSCCRLSGPNHVNNPDGDYQVQSSVIVNGSNDSPVALIPPIVNCPFNAVCTFPVPAFDPDGDPLRYRLATASEAGSGFVQPGPPDAPNAATVDASTGQYTWDTQGATLSGGPFTFYSTQVIIEDLDASGNPKSKIAVDFFIELVQAAGPPPTFPGTTPGQPQLVQVAPGQQVCFDVVASHPDPTEEVTLLALNVPPGATMNPPLPVVGNPAESEFCWTPPSAIPTPLAASGGTFFQAQSTGFSRMALTTTSTPISTHLVTFIAQAGGQQALLTYVLEVVESAGVRPALQTLADDLGDVDGGGKHLGKALKDLNRALGDRNWDDDNTLDAKRGHRVFNWLRNAAHRLTHQVSKDKKASQGAKDAADAVAVALVELARELAEAAIDDAESDGGNARNIAIAGRQLDRGDTKAGDGDARGAISHYRNAWRQAMSA